MVAPLPACRLTLAFIVLSTSALCGCGPETTTAPTVPGTAGSVAPSTDASGASDASAASAASDASAATAAPSSDKKRLFVRETRATCEGGEGPRKCLQVRESESGDWQLFYAPIKGFKYEEGTKYELEVSVRHAPNAPADASSLVYELVAIISQQKVPPGK
jgi:hypothetical protein